MYIKYIYDIDSFNLIFDYFQWRFEHGRGHPQTRSDFGFAVQEESGAADDHFGSMQPVLRQVCQAK